MWCKCFCHGWHQCWRRSMVLYGGRKSSLLWMVHRTTEVPTHVSASAIYKWKSYWAPPIATRLLQLSCGSPTLKEVHLTRIQSKQARRKYISTLILCIVRSERYQNSSSSKRPQSSQIVSYYYSATQSYTCSITSASHHCEWCTIKAV